MGELKNAKELLEIASKFSKWMIGEKSDALRIECMNNLGIYTTTVNVESKFSKWVQRLGKISKKFNPEDVYSVKVYGVNPPSGIIYDAVFYDEENKINLDFKRVLDYNAFGLEISYKMDTDWLRSIIRYRHSPEPLKDARKYHLQAQLKDPVNLTKGFSEFQIDEFPVIARVHIQQNIDLNIPSYVKRLTDIEAKILEDYNPRDWNRIRVLQMERAKLKKELGKKSLIEKMNQFSVFLRPNKFLDYINNEPTSDFRLHDCKWSEMLFRALGMVMLPKAMDVTSRTDLNINKPASSGTFIYESGKFSKDVKKFFEEK